MTHFQLTIYASLAVLLGSSHVARGSAETGLNLGGQFVVLALLQSAPPAPAITRERLWEENPQAKDLDELPEHQARLTEIIRQAQDNQVRRDRVQSERRPLMQNLSELAAEQKSLAASLLAVQRRAIRAAEAISRQEYLLQNANSHDAATCASNARARAQRVYDECDAEACRINGRQKSLQLVVAGIEGQLRPLNIEFDSLLREVVQLRVDWVSIRSPASKFSRADYEALFHLADDWIRLDPDFLDAYVWRGLAAWELNRREDGLADTKKAIDLWKEIHAEARKKPQWPWGMAAYGMMLSAYPQYRKEGESWLMKAKAGVGSKHAVVHYLSGVTEAHLGKDAKAAAQFRKALNENPDYVPALHRLARLSAESRDEAIRDPELAVRLAEQAWTQTGSRSWRILDSLILAYSASGEAAQRVAALERFAALCPERRPSRTAQVARLAGQQ